MRLQWRNAHRLRHKDGEQTRTNTHTHIQIRGLISLFSSSLGAKVK